MKFIGILLISILVTISKTTQQKENGILASGQKVIRTKEQPVTLPTKVKQKHVLHADTNVHTHDISHHHHANNAHHHFTDLHHYTYYNHKYNHVTLNRHYAPRVVNHSEKDNHFKFDRSWSKGRGGSKRCINGVWQ